MPIEDDPSLAFLLGRQCSVVIAVKKSLNFLIRLPPRVVLEYSHFHAGWIILAQVVCELDLLMNRVVMVDVSAYESDHDDCRRCQLSDSAFRRNGVSGSR